MNLKTLKKKLREKIHVTLRAQQNELNPEAPIAVRDFFLSHFKDLAPTVVISGTLPIKGELDPQPLLQALAEKGHRLCLPVILEKGKPLQFRAWRPGDPLDNDVWGIRMPKATQPVLVPEVVICPFLAFDRKGRRLGYGGGFYDATFRELRAKGKITAVGVGFAAQEVEEVPAGDLDQTLDLIITEKEVVRPEA